MAGSSGFAAFAQLQENIFLIGILEEVRALHALWLSMHSSQKLSVFWWVIEKAEKIKRVSGNYGKN